MSATADRAITALRTIHDDLAGRVAGFGDAELATTSGSSEWDVAQVLSHLGSGAEIFLAMLRSALSGQGAPDQDFNASVWARWDAMDRRAQADGFLEADERLVAAFESLDGAARDAVEVHLGFLPAPADLAVLTGMRLNEAALHAWDVRVAFDPQATLGGQEAAVELEVLTGPISFLVGFLGKPDIAGPVERTLRVETTDPERALTLVLGPHVSLDPIDPGSTVEGAAGAPVGNDGVLRGPAEAVVRLLAGRLDAAHTPAGLTLSGAAVTLDQLRRIFPGS